MFNNGLITYCVYPVLRFILVLNIAFNLQISTINEEVRIICPLIVLQLGHLKWEKRV